jgi:single-stranded-DNA-specific exonuclease
MATAADMVPLTGDNHTLVRHGLEILKKSQKPGVAALLTAAGLGSRELSPGHLGFVLGPRINASGRMGSASLALELLTTLDPVRAKELAEELEKINQERAEIQNKIWDEVKTQVEAGRALGRFKHGIVVADAGWHEGVVGIVASRVTEFFKKPAAILALREDFGKGSVRTFAGKDVLSALRSCSNLLLGFGGHRHAAGLSVSLDQWENFRQAFDDALGELGEDAQARPLWLDGECTIPELDIKTLQELENLGPFGPGNPEPLVRIQARIGSHRILKERHLKLSLSSSAQWPVSAIDAIWFHGVEHEAQILEGAGDSFDWVGVPELNRFRGSVTPTLRVRDCRGLNQ